MSLSCLLTICLLFAVTPAWGVIPVITGLDSPTHIVDDFFFSNDSPSFEWDAASDLPKVIGSHDASQTANDVAVVGDLAVVADGDAGVQFLDVSNVSTPTLLASLETSHNAQGVAVCGDVAYVADATKGLMTIDISEPTSPMRLGAYDTAGMTLDLQVRGDVVYLADQARGLLAIDISEPATPTLLGECPTPEPATGIAVQGDVAYVADFAGGLQVIDVSDPASPFILGSCETSSNAIGVDVSGDTAYVADYRGGLKVIDVSDPSTPAVVGTCDAPTIAADVKVVGDVAYVADAVHTMFAIDVSNPSLPTPIGSCDVSSSATRIDVAGDNVFAACSIAGLKVVKMAEFTALTSLGVYQDVTNVRDMDVSGDCAYVAALSEGLHVVDISDPTSPTAMGVIDTPDLAKSVAVSGDVAYVVDRNTGFLSVDISDPTSPTVLDTYDTPGDCSDVVIAGDTAYVADRSSGLLVFDISDPGVLSLLDSYDTNDARTVAVSGDTAYIGEFTSSNNPRLIAVDISDPSSVTLIDELGLSGGIESVNDIAVSGDVVFAVVGTYGLVSIDASDPSDLAILDWANTSGTSRGVSIAGDTVYVGDGTTGLYVYDASDPADLSLLDTYDTTGEAWRAVVSGDMVFIADATGGLCVASAADGSVGYSYTFDASSTTDPDVVPDSLGTSADIGGAPDGTLYFHVRAVGLRGEAGESAHRRVMIDTTPPVTMSDAVAEYANHATIELDADDGVGTSQVGFTYYKVDDATSWTVGTTVGVSGLGEHTLQFYSDDNAGNNETPNVVEFAIKSDSTDYIAVEGFNRYATAIKTSQQAFADGTADCVVIATGTNWPDALGGAALAAAKNGPILLTDPAVLSSGILAEVDRLGASEAIILGGTGAVSSEVEDALNAALGAANVDRIGESNRYTTAQAIAAATIAELDAGAGYDGTAFVATGANFPDALAASPLAAAKGWPIYLAEPGANPPTAQMKARGVTEALILGGESAINTTQETAIEAAFPGAVVRLKGNDRYETGVNVAIYGVDGAGLAWDGLALSTGQNFPDALAGGVLAGKNGSVMLLTESTSLPSSVRTKLTKERDWISDVYYLGGKGAISLNVRDEIAAILH